MKIFEFRKWIVLAFVAATFGAAFFASDLNIVYDFERIFAEDDPDLEFYHHFRSELAPDDNVVFVALPNEGGVFDKSFLRKTDSLTRALSEVPHAETVVSLTNFFNVVKSPFGVLKRPVLIVDEPDQYNSAARKIFADERLNGKLISPDRTTLNIIFKFRHGIDQPQTEEMIDSLENTIQRFNFPDYHTAGKSVIQVSFVRKQAFEIKLFTVLSALLVALVVFLIFRKPAIVLISLFSVFVATALFFGILGVTQIRLDFMSSLFPILMLIVGMSDVVHILSKYLEELKLEKPKFEALKITVKEIGLATFLTSLTTSIGFMALMTSKMSPIRDFGWLAAAGVFVAYFTVILFTSSLLLFCKNEWLQRNSAITSFLDFNWLNSVYEKVKAQNSIWISGYIMVVLISILGITQLSLSARVKNDIPRKEKIWTDFEFFESKFGGFRPLEIALLPQNGKKIDDLDVLKEIDRIEEFIRANLPVNGLFSPTMLYKSLHMAHNDGLQRFYELPDHQAVLDTEKRLLKELPENKINTMVNADKTLGKIAARMSDEGTLYADSIHAEVMKFVDTQIDPEILKCRITGTAFLFDSANNYLVKSLFNGLAVAFVLISFLMALLFRNLRMVLISLVPNVLPLIIVAGIMGFTGMVLDAPSSIIFVIAFGIAVDDTIHFLSKFKIERQRGLGLEEAIKKATTETGKAIIITSIILFFGFALLMFSDYVPTFRVGFLISLTLVIAMVVDLTLLPALLRVGLKEKS